MHLLKRHLRQTFTIIQIHDNLQKMKPKLSGCLTVMSVLAWCWNILLINIWGVYHLKHHNSRTWFCYVLTLTKSSEERETAQYYTMSNLSWSRFFPCLWPLFMEHWSELDHMCWSQVSWPPLKIILVEPHDQFIGIWPN